MNIEAVKLAYFSPTGTTGKILKGIAEGVGVENVEHINLTLPESESLAPKEFRNELVVIGAPVYEGRVAKTAVSRLQRLKAHGTPAVLVAVYGNRHFDDALIELNDLAREWGFLPIACGAFIGEHSFANESRPLANGRPDADDIAAARIFGAGIRAKMENLNSLDEAALVEPPGNRPYMELDRSALADRSATTIIEKCTLCGDCASICPVGAITVEEVVKTDNMACILCNACVKSCPEGARVVDDPMINKIAGWVSKNFQDRKEPATFI